MKILSLEEIEVWQDIAERYEYYELFDHINEDGLKALLNTARAYHELKSKSGPEDINEKAFKGIMNIALEKPEYAIKAEDKSHALTIKAIEGYNQEKNVIASKMATMGRYGQGEASYRLGEIDKAIKELVALTPSLQS